MVENSDGNQNTGQTGTPPGSGGMTFTPEQQEFINGLIGQKTAKHREQTDALLAKLESQELALKELQSNMPQKEEQPATQQPNGESEQVEILRKQLDAQLKAQQAEVEKIKSEREAERKRNRTLQAQQAIFEACTNPRPGALQAQDPSDIHTALKSEIGFNDDGTMFILDPTTNEPRVTAEGVMTVEKRVQEFLKAKPYLAKAQTQPGSGIRGGANGESVEPLPIKQAPNGGIDPVDSAKRYAELHQKMLARKE